LNPVGQGAELKGHLALAKSLGKSNALENSFGYEVIKDSWDGRVRQLKELRIMEISLVPWGCNDKSKVTAFKAANIDTKFHDFDTTLRNSELYSAPYKMGSALQSTIDSILMDGTLTQEGRQEALRESLLQFNDRFNSWIDQAFSAGLFKSAFIDAQTKSQTSLLDTPEPLAGTRDEQEAETEPEDVRTLEDAMNELGNRIEKLTMKLEV
jgi:hypothetical protein